MGREEISPAPPAQEGQHKNNWAVKCKGRLAEQGSSRPAGLKLLLTPQSYSCASLCLTPSLGMELVVCPRPGSFRAGQPHTLLPWNKSFHFLLQPFPAPKDRSDPVV